MTRNRSTKPKAKCEPIAKLEPQSKETTESKADSSEVELFRAVMRDDVEQVKALAAAGLDVLKVRNKSGQSAEQLARERCKEKTLSRGPRCKLQKSRIV
eukprot:g19760.t1